jgi:hypothetical protein
MSDPITDELHAATGIPYEKMCHHQTRVLCTGCPDEKVCRVQRIDRTPYLLLTYKGKMVYSIDMQLLPKELADDLERDADVELEMEVIKP